MKTGRIFKAFFRHVKSHILCTHSAFIEKNAMAALQDSFTDLSKLTFFLKKSDSAYASVFRFFNSFFAFLKIIESNYQHHQVLLLKLIYLFSEKLRKKILFFFKMFSETS
jgi:hypothetical protein